MFVRGLQFSRLHITNTAQAGEWIRLLIVREDARKFQIENPAVHYSEMDLIKDTTIGTVQDMTLVGGAAAAIILPADPDRSYALIRNMNTNAKTLRIGDTNTAVDRGVSLRPDEVLTLHGTGAIYGYNPAGANEDVSITYVAS
jgi:hypothetical protein